MTLKLEQEPRADFHLHTPAVTHVTTDPDIRPSPKQQRRKMWTVT